MQNTKRIPAALLALFLMSSCTKTPVMPVETGLDTVSEVASVTVQTEEARVETTLSVKEEPPAIPVLHASDDSIREDIRDWLSDDTVETVREASGDAAADAFGVFTEKRRIENAFYCPTLDGEPIPLRQKEGLPEISLFSAELYNRPWIWYHCAVDDIVFIVKIMYIDNDVQINGAAEYGVSWLVHEIAPTAPNVDNYTLFENYEKIETVDITFRDFSSQTMVSTPRDHDRRFYTFVYKDILVSIQSNQTEFPDTDIFQRLSFDTFVLTE